jgi:outer membrane protein TolC
MIFSAKNRPLSLSIIILGAMAVALLTSCSTGKIAHSKATPGYPTPSSTATPNEQTSIAELAEPIFPLTLNAAIERALICDPQIARLHNEIELINDSLTPNLRDPELRLGYGEDSSDISHNRWDSENSTTTGNVNGDRSSYRVAVRFFPPNLWTHSAIDTQRKAIYAEAQAKLKAQQNRIASDIRVSFAEISHLKRSRQRCTTLVKLYEQQQKKANELSQNGNLSSFESIAFSRRYLRALSKLTKLNLQYNTAIQQLASKLRIPSSQISLSNYRLLQLDLSDSGVRELEALMLHSRSDLAALAWHRIAAEAKLKKEQRERLPWIQHLQLSYGTDDTTTSGSDTTLENDGNSTIDWRDDRADNDEWAVTTAISIPLFGLQNHTIKKLAKEANQASEAETQKISQEQFKLHDACRNLLQQRQLLRQHRKQMQPLISKIRAALDSGEVLKSLPFEEQAALYEELADAKQLELDLQFNYHLAVIKLDRLIGRPSFHVASSPLTN